MSSGSSFGCSLIPSMPSLNKRAVIEAFEFWRAHFFLHLGRGFPFGLSLFLSFFSKSFVSLSASLLRAFSSRLLFTTSLLSLDHTYFPLPPFAIGAGLFGHFS
jgi:hypothetical protein